MHITGYGAGGFGVLPGGGMRKRKRRSFKSVVTTHVSIVPVNDTSPLICQAYDTQLELEWDREQENQEKVVKKTKKQHFFYPNGEKENMI